MSQEPIGIDPTVDFAFKRLLGDPAHADITIHFLNAVLGESLLITEIEFVNPILGKEGEDDKEAVLDVLAKDSRGRMLNIEMQTTVSAELRDRLTYYVASLYSMRGVAGSRYVEFRPAICICVMDGILFPSVRDMHLDFRLRGRRGLSLTEHLQIHTIELPKYRSPRNNRRVSRPLEQWVYFLRNAANQSRADIERRLADEVFSKATGVLEMISKSADERILYEFSLKRVRDEDMRLRHAEKTGREAGREEGREQGVLIGEVRLLQQLLGEPQASIESLGALEIAELKRLVVAGQQRLRERQ